MRKEKDPAFCQQRLGFHYYPDTFHYREADLHAWLPVLEDLGASWLVLHSEVDRAIPESFLRGLKGAGIEPLIQFSLPLERMPDLKEIGTLVDVYARWGARYAVFYDSPNARQSWPAAAWAQQDLVERFLDRFLPAAELGMQAGIAPVFPPLEPGGSYWDTAFLRSALQGIARRKHDLLLQSLVISAYARVGAQPGEDRARCSLSWGAGGPQRWPDTRPYHTPAGAEDQRGFRIFDWYTSVARSVLHLTPPVILLQAGLPTHPDRLDRAEAFSAHSAGMYMDIARLLAGEPVTDRVLDGSLLEPLPANVIACSFWLLASEPSSPYAGQAWFPEPSPADAVALAQYPASQHPAVDMLRAMRREWRARPMPAGEVENAPAHPIHHYLLLPGFEWGVSDWYLEVIRPYVKKYRPTVGFSADEALQAERVTIVGSTHHFPEDFLERLHMAGCFVEQIGGDGTNIATELAER